jgi:hypothetical protein
MMIRALMMQAKFFLVVAFFLGPAQYIWKPRKYGIAIAITIKDDAEFGLMRGYVHCILQELYVINLSAWFKPISSR